MGSWRAQDQPRLHSKILEGWEGEKEGWGRDREEGMEGGGEKERTIGIKVADWLNMLAV